MLVTNSMAKARPGRYAAPTKDMSTSTPAEPQGPADQVTLSGGGDEGWKMAGIMMMLAAVPVGAATRSLAVGAMMGVVGVGLMFGPDD